MRNVLLYVGLAGLAYTAYHIWNQASTPGAGGTTAAIKNWGVTPVGLGSVAALGYVLITR